MIDSLSGLLKLHSSIRLLFTRQNLANKRVEGRGGEGRGGSVEMAVKAGWQEIPSTKNSVAKSKNCFMENSKKYPLILSFL